MVGIVVVVTIVVQEKIKIIKVNYKINLDHENSYFKQTILDHIEQVDVLVN